MQNPFRRKASVKCFYAFYINRSKLPSAHLVTGTVICIIMSSFSIDLDFFSFKLTVLHLQWNFSRKLFTGKISICGFPIAWHLSPVEFILISIVILYYFFNDTQPHPPHCSSQQAAAEVAAALKDTASALQELLLHLGLNPKIQTPAQEPTSALTHSSK